LQDKKSGITTPTGRGILKYFIPELPPVFVDPRQIGQVLRNLVANAYQAMPEGGNLTISAQAEKEKVSLFITDTGCGISKENMEKIFEPLFTTISMNPKDLTSQQYGGAP